MSSQRRLRVVREAEEAPSAGDRLARLDALLADVGRGDEGAYAALYDAVAGAVFGMAVRVVRDRAIAEEVAQDVLVEVWRRASRFDASAGSARTWILTIAHRRAIDRVRSEQAHTDRVLAHGATVTGTQPEPDDVVDTSYREWQAQRVREGLDRLTERQREAIDLAFTKGYTHREVARALDVPLGTAKARIRDGLIRLRDGWEEER